MWWKKNKAEVCGYLDKYGHFHQNRKDRDLFNLKLEVGEVQQKIDGVFREAIKVYQFVNQTSLTICDNIDTLEQVFHYIHAENKLYIYTLQDELESIRSEIKKLEK